MKLILNGQKRAILRNEARFKTIVAGRRYGKTHLALMYLLGGQIDNNELRWYIAPTYRQGKMIAWRIIKHLLGNQIDKVKFNESELDVIFPNNAVISIKGADNEDSLRGAGIHKMVLDEYAYMKASVWPEVLRPMLSDTKGDTMFIGTPDGFNHFYDIYIRGLSGDKRYKSWQFRSVDGGFIDTEEIEQAKQDLDIKTFRQEYEASFETATNKIYYNFDRNVHLKECQYSELLPLHITFDFNVNPMHVAIIQENGGVSYQIDEIVIPTSNTHEVCREFICRYDKHSAGLTVYGDASGHARTTKSHQTDYQIIRDTLQKINNFDLRVPLANPAIRDRINSVNARLKNAKGEIKYYINPACHNTIKSFERTQYKEGTSDIDKTMNIEHITDAIGYYINVQFPIRQIEAWSIRR